MKRILLLLMSFLIACVEAQSATRPNVIYIMAAATGRLLRTASSSENIASQKFARNAIDGDATTLWHTKFTNGVTPHELLVDLGAEHTIRGFIYLGRQDAGWNGAINDVEFRVSTTADQFAAPVAKAALAKSKEPQTIPCQDVKGRYVQLRALTEHGGNTFATVAKLGILGE